MVTPSALARGRLVRIPRPVYAYRQAAGSVYTSMSPAERAALNVYGLGVGLRVMGPGWEKDVTARFASAVWMAWFLRKQLPQALNPGKYEAYLDGCRRAGFSSGEKLLRFPELSPEEQKEIKRWVRRVGRLSPPRVLYAWTQVHARRNQF